METEQVQYLKTENNLSILFNIGLLHIHLIKMQFCHNVQIAYFPSLFIYYCHLSPLIHNIICLCFTSHLVLILNATGCK